MDHSTVALTFEAFALHHIIISSVARVRCTTFLFLTLNNLHQQIERIDNLIKK